MDKATTSHGAGVRSGAMIEGLENRTMMSISPAATTLPATFGKVTPATIQPFKSGVQPVTLHNPGASSLSETVTVTLKPSLDGTTSAGSYSNAPFTQAVTLKPHGSQTVKVPFTPPTSGLSSGKYRNLINVVFVNGPVSNENGVSSGTFTYKAPPGPTVSPSLVGKYTGKINVSATTGGGGTLTHILGVIWDISSQTLTDLTGTVTVGDVTESGTFTGFETTTGTFNFSFASVDGKITFTWSNGKVIRGGAELTAKSVGTLSPDNLFPHMNGTLKLFKS
jgi:hypothetical protein